MLLFSETMEGVGSMLGFIPMTKSASIYRLGAVDSWGQPAQSLVYTGKCIINYNTNLDVISGEDGRITTMSATIVFHGKIEVYNGDYIEFTTALGVTGKHLIVDVYFLEDYAGKIVATRVVTGSGNRS